MSQSRRGWFLNAAGALLIALLGAPSAGAQPRVVGVLSFDKSEVAAAGWDELLGGGLRGLGHKVGQSLVIEYRWAEGDVKQYPRLARELVARRPVVIVTLCGPSQRAIRELSRTQHIISLCADEVNFLGEVASLSRPGGYTTGMMLLSAESVGKRLELMKEIRPGLSRLAVLYDANTTIPAIWRELERLQPLLGLTLQRLPVGRAEDMEPAFEAMVRERAQAVFVFPDDRMIGENVRVAELALKHRVATVFDYAVGAEAGLLLSYGASVREFLGTIVPMYVDKILRGEKPGDIPIAQPTRFVLVVNMKTARALGLKIPPSILTRADRVIE